MIRTALLALFCSSTVAFAADKAPAQKAPPAKGKTVIAVFETSMGTFKAKLFPDKAPKTVANFVGLAEGTIKYKNPKTGEVVKGTPEKPGKSYYDGVIFHRVINGFMIQGGDPTGTGTGGPDHNVDDEVSPDLKHDKAGKLSMAKTAAPNSAGSQFFITVASTPHLDGGYTQFGEVIEGLDHVMEIAKVETDRGDRPKTPVVIKSIRIERK